MLILSAKIVLFFELCKFFGVGLSEIVGIYRKLSDFIGRAAQINWKTGDRMPDNIRRNGHRRTGIRIKLRKRDKEKCSQLKSRARNEEGEQLDCPNKGQSARRIVSGKMDEAYCTCWPWRVKSLSPRRMKSWLSRKILREPLWLVVAFTSSIASGAFDRPTI